MKVTKELLAKAREIAPKYGATAGFVALRAQETVGFRCLCGLGLLYVAAHGEDSIDDAINLQTAGVMNKLELQGDYADKSWQKFDDTFDDACPTVANKPYYPVLPPGEKSQEVFNSWLDFMEQNIKNFNENYA